MGRNSIIAGVLLVLISLTGPAIASEKYRIDPEHVSVNFSMQHSKWAKYQGTVRKIAGTIVFDKERVENSSVEIEMEAKSVDTLNVERDFE